MMEWYARGLSRTKLVHDAIVVPTRYGETHMVAAGPQDAPPVVLLHGMEGNAASWRHQMASLAPDHRVYALDIIGSAGKSATTRLSHDNHEYAEWLKDVFDGLRIDQAHLVGISNGSWLILKFAAHASERIASAVLMSANGIAPVRFPYRLARTMDLAAIRSIKDVLAGALLTRGLVNLAVTRVEMAGQVIDPDELEWFYLLAKHYRFPPGPVSDADMTSLKAPSLLLMGEHEHFFNVKDVITRAQALLPNLRSAEVIGGVGHNMCTDNPTFINARLRRFLTTAK
jgi:pimeloyl-ACP methyl ester carboxylesterase